MIRFNTTLLKFDRQGEKTGWTYIKIPAALAAQLYPVNKKSFRVTGKLDHHVIKGVALLPMGEGDFIMAINAAMRKGIGKRKGATVNVQLSVDKAPYQLNKELMECMADEPASLGFFKTLPLAHQHYFSKWVESAKTENTKASRIAQAVSALARKWGFPEMLRAKKNEKDPDF